MGNVGDPDTRRGFLKRAAAAGAGALATGCEPRRSGDAASASPPAQSLPLDPACRIGLDIRDFGATERGDLRPALQAATEAAARGEAGGIVFIPPGRWTFLTKTGNGRFVTPPRDRAIFYRGVPGASVITVADGILEWDGFRMDGPGSVTFEDLVFDGNAAGNIVPKDEYLLQSWIYFDHCERLVMRNVEFRNHAGIRCVSAGNGIVGPRTAGEVELRQVHARNVGSAVRGNVHIPDHSTLWVNADACSIIGCTSDNDALGIYDTFIENHSSNALVTSNHIRNVRLGIIVGAQFHDHVNSLYLANVMDRVESGYRFYAMNGRRLDVTVHGGMVRQTGGKYPIFDTGYCSDPADRIAFYDVSAENVDDSARGAEAPAFALGKVRNFEVNGGTLRAVGGSILALTTHMTPGDGIAAATLRGITAIDCARSADVHGEAVALHARNAAESLRAVVIEQCTFRNSSTGGPMRQAIAGTIDVTDRIAIQRNTFVRVDPGCAWSPRARVGRIELDVVDPSAGASDPNARGVRASAGSQWRDVAAGYVYEYSSDAGAASAAAATDGRWVRTVAVTDERLPRNGVWRVGDRVRNLPAGGRPRTVHGQPGQRYVVEYWEAWREATLGPRDDPSAIFAERRLFTGT